MSMAMNVSGRSACLALLLPAFAHADLAPELSSNPFARPISTEANGAPVRLNKSESSDAILDLKATLVFGDGGLANVAGQVLRPGDKIDGFQLIAVKENHAVFERDRQLFTVYVKPHLVGNDES